MCGCVRMCASVRFACVCIYVCKCNVCVCVHIHVHVLFTCVGMHTCVSMSCFHMWVCLSLLMCTEATGGCQVLFYHFPSYSPETGTHWTQSYASGEQAHNPPVSTPPKDGITGMQEAMPGFLQGYWELNSGPNVLCRCLHQLSHLLSP